MPLDARYRAASQTHAGLILVSAKTFPQDRAFTATITSPVRPARPAKPGPARASALSPPPVIVAVDGVAAGRRGRVAERETTVLTPRRARPGAARIVLPVSGMVTMTEHAVG
jgi:hypothetical protein